MFAVLTLATGALAYNATTTNGKKIFTTIECSTPTTLAIGNTTYTVTAATTLTVEDCGCTASSSIVGFSGNSTNSTSPSLVNGAQAAQVGAAAGVVAAVALLI